MPFYPFWGEGSPTKIDYRKKGTQDLGKRPILENANKVTKTPKGLLVTNFTDLDSQTSLAVPFFRGVFFEEKAPFFSSGRGFPTKDTTNQGVPVVCLKPSTFFERRQPKG